MSAHYVGQDTSWRTRASQAVSNAAQARWSNLYGFSVTRFRDPVTSELKFRERVLVDLSFDDARSWFDTMSNTPGLNYVAVFNRANLETPIMEHTTPSAVAEPPAVSGYDDGYGSPGVGAWWAFPLGLGLGAGGGYFLRRWQEPAASRSQVQPLRETVRSLLPGGGGPSGGGPGGAQPKVGYPWMDFVGQDPYVGGYPWVDFVGQDPYQDAYQDPYVGAYPWTDMVGQEAVGGYPWVDFVGNEYVGDEYVGNEYVVNEYTVNEYVGNEYDIGNEYVGCADGYSVGGPWVEFAPWVGAETEEAGKRRMSEGTRLIQAASKEAVTASENQPSASFWVWSLTEPAQRSYGASGAVLTSEPMPMTEPYDSLATAMARVRQLGQTPGIIARAVFDRTSRHWPNPITWSKSTEPQHAQMIAQYTANRWSMSTSGEYVGAEGSAAALESAKNALRDRAVLEAKKHAGDYLVVIHTTRDNLWHTLGYDEDYVEDGFNIQTQDQNSYTYAALFDKVGFSRERPYIQKFGGYAKPAPGSRPRRAPIVGATRAEIEAYRKSTQETATAIPGAAVVVVITADDRAAAILAQHGYQQRGLSHSKPFRSLDDAIDGLNSVTGLGKANYIYAGAFDKGRDGTASVQGEEFGDASVPVPPGTIPRDRPATTMGDDVWWAA